MSERSQNLMSKIWEKRDSGADTEEKLVSAILRIVSEEVKFYKAQGNKIVLDKEDLLNLANELCESNE